MKKSSLLLGIAFLFLSLSPVVKILSQDEQHVGYSGVFQVKKKIQKPIK